MVGEFDLDRHGHCIEQSLWKHRLGMKTCCGMRREQNEEVGILFISFIFFIFFEFHKSQPYQPGFGQPHVMHVINGNFGMGFRTSEGRNYPTDSEIEATCAKVPNSPLFE